jgi:uncharacterized delta-60 repeat protein
MHSFFLVLILFSSSLSSFAQASFFDPTFGTGGEGLMPLSGSGNGGFDALELLPDGKVVIAVSVFGKGGIGKYKSNGTLDSTFGVNGFFWLSPVSGVFLRDVTVQPDGKVIEVGTKDSKFFALRLNADGTTDAGFGVSGTVSYYYDLVHDNGEAVAVQADGRIVLVGSTSPSNLCLMRLLEDGGLDSAFGINGKLIGPYGSGEGVVVQPDGRIVAGGTASAAKKYAMMAVRYLADGTPDLSFNGTGVAFMIAGEERSNFGRALAVQPDGKVLVAGTGGFGAQGSDFAVVRFNADGTSDMSFGADGVAHIDFGEDEETASSMFCLTMGR